MTRRGRWSALGAVALLLASCTSDGAGPPGEPPSAAPLDGRILATGFFGGENLAVYDLATRETTALPVPEGAEVLDAIWGPDGETAYAIAGGFNRARLYETIGGEARPIGRAFKDPEAEVLGVAGSTVLLVECLRDPKLLVLDLDGAREWEEVAPGCAGAFGRDGSTILYADGKTVREVPIGGGRARILADLRTVLDEDGATVRTTAVFDIRRHNSAVIATVVVDGRAHPAIGEEGGRFRLVRLEDYPSSVGVAPQPGGDLIALTQGYGNARTGALIRMYDLGSESYEVVGAGPGGYFEPVWAPDGETMVTSNEAGNWVFIDAAGDWLDVRRISGLMAQDWTQ